MYSNPKNAMNMAMTTKIPFTPIMVDTLAFASWAEVSVFEARI